MEKEPNLCTFRRELLGTNRTRTTWKSTARLPKRFITDIGGLPFPVAGLQPCCHLTSAGGHITTSQSQV